MYAYIPDIGGGFFEGVCTPSNATAHSYDPPPPATHRNRNPPMGLRPDVDHASR
jgi:hypothetical protein